MTTSSIRPGVGTDRVGWRLGLSGTGESCPLGWAPSSPTCRLAPRVWWISTTVAALRSSGSRRVIPNRSDHAAIRAGNRSGYLRRCAGGSRGRSTGALRTKSRQWRHSSASSNRTLIECGRSPVGTGSTRPSRVSLYLLRRDQAELVLEPLGTEVPLPGIALPRPPRSIMKPHSSTQTLSG